MTLHQHKTLKPKRRSSVEGNSDALFNGGQSNPDINNTTMASHFEGQR